MSPTQEQVTAVIGDTLQRFGADLPAGEDDLTPVLAYAILLATAPVDDSAFGERLLALTQNIELGMHCTVRVDRTEGRGWFVQIQCYREDTITKKMGYGFGGKAYPSEHATDSEIIQMIFGLYKSYWEHEARETFIWRGRRPFGPHISTEALWEVARRVDVRSQKHEEDRDEAPKLANDCECEDREALVRPEGLVCGTCGKVISGE